MQLLILFFKSCIYNLNSSHYCPLKIASRSLKLLEYSLLQEILMRNDLKS